MKAPARIAAPYLFPLALVLSLLLTATWTLTGCNRNKEDDASSPSPSNTAPGSTPATYGSNLERVDCQAIEGWVWDAGQPNTPIKVDVYDGTTLLGTATGDISRKDLSDTGKGDGKHGFHFPVPAVLKDGKPHTIKVTVSGTSIQLSSSPKTVTCSGGAS